MGLGLGLGLGVRVSAPAAPAAAALSRLASKSEAPPRCSMDLTAAKPADLVGRRWWVEGGR